MSEELKKRTIRSFVLRTGRMTSGQQRAVDDNWPRWGLQHTDALLDIESVFQRAGPSVLEIGFGMGQSLVEMAHQSPNTNFIGIEVHKPGVGKLFHNMVERDVNNVRVYCHDAVEILRDCISESSLDAVQIFFPDPWHKKKHHKRRLIQAPFVDLLVSRLKPGGTLHLATDWEHYALQMQDVLTANVKLENKYDDDGYAPGPENRPQTKFEKRGERLGHGVWDLVFTRTG